ncbi:MAG: transglycosylase SLT domain-containing protein, partial [Halioglobus sp.]|nr:transglycosylase SLT domain-containing protein [Halioglobus sp.]
ERELQEVEQKWQMMDALLVGAVKHYAAATGLQALRDTLFEILVDSRYRLRDALTEPAHRSDDAVRRWFIESWQRLAPVARSVALEQPGQEHLLWFSVLTATDALHALDELGPGIGLDISSNGLRHLARLINAHSGDDWLRYSEEVDPQLRQLLQQQLDASPPDTSSVEPTTLRLDFSLFPRAHADSPADRLNRWVPVKKELGAYLPVIAGLLEETAAQVSSEYQLDQRYADLYRNLVLTTAWQESCWRQYTVIEQRIEPLRSSSGDTGLMQINERVWRGFYDIQKLRWDIHYNVRAGAEVLLNYLVKYALRKGEHQQTGGLPNLARASYSAYNGGPGQVARYRRSGVPSALRKVDTLFWDKYQQVERGNKLNVVTCLDGAASGASLAAANARPAGSPATGQAADKQTAPISPGRAAEAADTARRWLLAQPAQHFTLQLATFSTRDAASNFIRQQALPAAVQVYARRQGQSIQYLVLHGSYPSRAAADPDKRHYASLQPWLRQFGDLHQTTGR